MKKSIYSRASVALILVSTLAVSGCSMFNKAKSLDVEAGPDNTPYTEDIIDNVPDGIVGDTENKRQTTERLRSSDE